MFQHSDHRTSLKFSSLNEREAISKAAASLLQRSGKITARGPCPLCAKGPRDAALVVTRKPDGLVAHCHRCHASAGFRPDEASPRRKVSPKVLDQLYGIEAIHRTEKIKRIWQQSKPIHAQSRVGKYLLGRGCELPDRIDETHIRELLPSERHPFTTMLALVTDAVTTVPLTLHFTELSDNGKRGTRRLLGGLPKKGGVIRLATDDMVSFGLTIAEGIETALSVPQPAWACVDAGNMSNFPVLEGIECLTIAADNDEAGLRAAKQCAARWINAGLDVRVVVPNQGDWNDQQPG